MVTAGRRAGYGSPSEVHIGVLQLTRRSHIMFPRSRSMRLDGFGDAALVPSYRWTGAGVDLREALVGFVTSGIWPSAMVPGPCLSDEKVDNCTRLPSMR